MFLKSYQVSLRNFTKKLIRDKREIKVLCRSRIQEFSSEDSRTNLGDRYTPEEQNVILEKVNKGTIDELKKYKISEGRLKRITAFRDKHGDFKSVEEILLLQGMEADVLEKFCKSMVASKPSKKHKSLNSKTNLLFPALNEELRSGSRTYTGIWIWGQLISWSQVDSDCNLLEWKCQSLEDVVMKDGLIAIVETVANVITNVPKSDAYIMEGDPIIPFSRMNSTAYFLHLQRQQITSTIVSILGMREKQLGGVDRETMINNIYMLRSRTPARLFDLLVGSEIVSAKGVVNKMINNQEKYNSNNIININVNPDIKEYYRSRDTFEREQMNWALLLTSTFLNLYIRKGSRSSNSSNSQPPTS